MKAMKTTLAVLVLSIVAAGTTFSQELGLDSSTTISVSDTGTASFTPGERLDGWWNLPLGTKGSVFQGSGHVGATIDLAVESPELALNGDIDELKLSLVFPAIVPEMKSMTMEMGRLRIKDQLGFIVSHPADGASLGFDYSALRMTFQAGYTGLVLRNANSISMSLYDQSVKTGEESWSGSSRLLALAQMTIPSLLKQSINLSFVAQQDMNPEDALIPQYTQVRDVSDPPKGGKLDSQYSSLEISGQIIPNLFYDTWFSYGSGQTLTWLSDAVSASGFSYQYVPISSFLTGLSLDYYVPALLGAAFNARFLYASGDADYTTALEGNTVGKATQFIPMTSTSLGAVFSPALSNLIVAEASGSVKPVAGQRLQTGLKVLAFWRPTPAPLAVSGLAPGEDAAWLGFETDIYANYRILSDLGVSLSTGVFLPAEEPNGAFADGSLQFSASIAMTLSM